LNKKVLFPSWLSEWVMLGHNQNIQHAPIVSKGNFYI
jgi:hypothetical protein